MKKGAVIFTEGGTGIGFGHLSRCFALYHAFKKRGVSPLFVVNDDPAACAFLSTLGVTDVQTRPRAESLDGVEKLEGDVAVVDSYRLPLSAYQGLSARFHLLTSIDDENRLPYPAGLVVNGALYATGLPYEKREGVAYLLGSSYFLLRPEFTRLPEHVIRETVSDILITVGGVDWCHLTRRLMRVSGENPEVTLHVLTTDGFENLEEIHRTAEEIPAKVRFYHNPRNLAALMLRCDLALSAGGQTTYELAACGTPTIGACTAQNQLMNLMAWEKAGFLCFAGWENDPGFEENLKGCLKAVWPVKARETMSREGRTRMDGKGPGRVADAILGYGDQALKLQKTGSL